MKDTRAVQQIAQKQREHIIDSGIVRTVRGQYIDVLLDGTKKLVRDVVMSKSITTINVGWWVVIVRAPHNKWVALVALESTTTGSVAISSDLTTPANVTATAKPYLIELSWSGSFRNVATYEVQHNSSASESGATMLKIEGSNFFYWCAPGTQRYFRVRAVSSSFERSAWSSWVDATSTTGAAYMFLGVNAAGTSPIWTAFDWDNVAGVAGADMAHDHSAAGEGGQSLLSLIELSFNAATELTISGGSVTRTQVCHTIDTESDDPTDDLDTIAGGADGKLIIIRPADDARTVVVKHNTGNIWLSGRADISLNDAGDTLILLYVNALTKWVDIGWSEGGGGGAPADAEYLVLTLDDTLTAERRLVAGAGLALNDGGANGDATLSLDDHDHTGDAGDGGKLDHGAALNGLGDDDHAQYLLVDGTRPMTGALDLNGIADALILDLDGDTTISAPTDDQMDFEVAGADQIHLVDGKLYPDQDNDMDLGDAAHMWKKLYLSDALALSGCAKITIDADGDTAIWGALGDDSIEFDIGGTATGWLRANGWGGPAYSFLVKNTSGAPAALGDIGYIDENGEYKTTATAYDDVAWCVVAKSGNHNADICVARRGRVTATLNGDCSVGDYLYTSTTAGQAQPHSYTRPELFAVALTANAAGAGGTCTALLLCHTRFVRAVSAAYVLGLFNVPASDFRAQINEASPVGAVVDYDNDTGELSIDVQTANQLAKIRLYNETDEDYCLIDDVDTAGNQITLTEAAPVGWDNNEWITARSQVCVIAGPPYYFDLDLSSADNTAVPPLARSVLLDVMFLDAVAGQMMVLHPWQAFNSAQAVYTYAIVNSKYSSRQAAIPLIQRRFCVYWSASGAATARVFVNLSGYWEAVP